MKMRIASTHLYSALVAAATIVVIGNAQSAKADVITYIFSGTGNGRLGANFFTNAPFTLTTSADPAQVTDLLPPVLKVSDYSASVSITGIGNATFTTNFQTLHFNNPNASESGVGLFLYYQGPKLIFMQGAAFLPYTLTTSFGPQVGNSTFSANLFPTTAGDFLLTAVSSGSFQAVLQTVPEPATLSLFGLLGVVMVIQRRRSLGKNGALGV
jgi:PEP-CTERM motif